MRHAELIYRISVAMSNYNVIKLDKIYNKSMEVDKEAQFPPFNINARADLFLIGCAYLNHDWGFAGELLYYAKAGIKDEFYTEDELIKAVQKRMQLRKISTTI